MKKLIWILALCLSLFAHLTPVLSAAETTSAAFLKNGVGARALGMGEAYTAIADAADALYWNPAGLAKADSADILVHHQPSLGLLTYDVGAFSMPVGENHFGAAYSQLQSNSINSFDQFGTQTGSFQSKDQLFMGGYGRAVGAWQWGLAGEYIHSSLANHSGTAYAMNAGVGVENPYSKKWSHALVVQNLGTSMTLSETSSPLPLMLKLGTGYRPTNNVVLGLDFGIPRNGSLQAALGGEWGIPLQNNMGLFLRSGYTTAYDDLGGMAGLSFGGGVNFSGLRLDFAWLPKNDFGSSEVFTLGYRFGAEGHNSLAQNAPASKEKTALLVPIFEGTNLSQTKQSHQMPRRTVHVVAPGETLGKLSQQFYGTSQKWNTIYNANKNVISNPNSLDIGITLVIP